MTKRRQPDVSVSALSRMNMRDMLVLPDTASQTMADLTRYYDTDATTQGAAAEVASRESLESAYGFSPQDQEDRKPFVYQDGIAVIPIHGTLLNRFNGSWGFVTGYQYIRRMLNLALDDDDVEAIVFDVDSPGGEAAGCFELAREIMASRRVKPSLAMVDSVAASGGMALAASATTVYAIPSARVGSIGVYRMHISHEENLKKDGVKVTFASAGDHKVDGNMYQDLPQSVLDEWRESAGKTWDDFISLVAEARGLTEDEVRGTQARVYRADEALAKGLINAVKTPTEAVAAFLAELAEDDPSQDGDEEMNDKTKASEATSGLTEADFTKIGSMIATTVSTAVSGLTRSQTIKDYAASKGKAFAALASTLIADDNITVESAKAAIDAAASALGATVGSDMKKKKGKQRVESEDEDEDGDAEEGDEDGDDDGEAEEEAARASRLGKDKVNHLDRAMGSNRQPNVGAGKGGKENTDDKTPKEKANALLADHAAVTGADWSGKASKAA